MSDDSQALIREIEEEVRRERWAKLWDKYGYLAIGAAGAVVILVGGWQWYVTYQRTQAQTAGSQFQEALVLLSGDDKQRGIDGLGQIAKEGTPAYAALAKLRLAGNAREAGKEDDALKLYGEVADNTAADTLLRDFARLQIASLKVDTGSWTDVQNRLNDLAGETSPWRYSARELLGLAAYRHKKWAEARDAYATLLSNPDVPASMRQRAQTAMALIAREEAAAGAGKPVQGKASQAGGKADLKNDKPADKGGDKGAAAGSAAGDAKGASAPPNGADAKNEAKKDN